MQCVQYREDYRFQLQSNFEQQTAMHPESEIQTRFILLRTDGRLLVRAGYAWDGVSGPVPNTTNMMRATLVHDALYQLMREGHLNPALRDVADAELRRISIEDGVSSVRVWLQHWGVRAFGKAFAEPASLHPTLYAPQNCEKVGGSHTQARP